MSISPCPTPDLVRICLIGSVGNDLLTLQAAQKLGVPVIVSDTGKEHITDEQWLTYFVINDFEGPIYQTIYKTKHK